MTARLRWQTNPFGGIYADGAHHRYYVIPNGRRWTLRIRTLTTVAGVRFPDATIIEDTHDLQRLAKATATAHETEPPVLPGRPNRYTRAISAAYDQENPR